MSFGVQPTVKVASKLVKSAIWSTIESHIAFRVAATTVLPSQPHLVLDFLE